jgi:ABC-2 type transport system ATP-binding protein
MEEIMIRADGLEKRFGENHAVGGVSLQVSAGEIYGLVGPDAAGKTTFVRLLCGALTLDAGSVSLGGVDVAATPEKARELIGYLAQRFSLYEELTVYENLRFFAEVRGMPASQWEPRSREILEFVGLMEFTGRRAGQLSGGMKQKLGLALAMVNRPRILLLDEPTTGVDPVTRQDFWRLIIRLIQDEKPAVLVSTPYMDEAARCTRVGFLRAGKLISEGTHRQLREKLAGCVLEMAGEPQALLAEIGRGVQGVENLQRFGNRYHIRVKPGAARGVMTALSEKITSAGGRVEILRLVEPQLEDAFIALSGEAA